MKLLITESDPLVRRWLGLRAEELGVHLEFAGSAGELMAAIGGSTPDCVVLDACSSATDTDAAPVWRQLREAPETQHIPILLYSSSSRWQTLAELAGATVDGFIPKPFTADAIVSAAQLAATRSSGGSRRNDLAPCS